MKKIFAAMALLALAGAANAQVDLAVWTFEASVPTTAGPHAAEGGLNAGVSSPASGFHAGTTAYSNPVGNGSVESFSSTNWLIGDYYEVRTSTLGWSGITVTWDHASSSTGPRDFGVFVSTDGGVNFSNIFNYAVLLNGAPNVAWTSGGSRNPAFTNSVTLGAGADNIASLIVRFQQTSNVAANGTTVASTGTSRVDNIQISAIPTPGATALLGLAGLVAVRRRRA